MEVHLWRGSEEQRALRIQDRKLGQFAYFNEHLAYPDWRDKKVLDFGGSSGNLLLNPECEIRAEDYYCLDVVKEALDIGRKAFPSANWIHYDRYNCSFNPEGIADLPVPDIGIEFDFILAYSVFTHTTREEMNEMVAQLRAKLAVGGQLAFTFIDPHFESWPSTYRGNNLKWRLEKFREADPSIDVIGLLEKSRGAKWCALVDGRHLFVDSNGVWQGDADTCMTYDVFHTAGFLQEEFPHATIRSPVNNEMQHCCITRSGK